MLLGMTLEDAISDRVGQCLQGFPVSGPDVRQFHSVLVRGQQVIGAKVETIDSHPSATDATTKLSHSSFVALCTG
jgi:hypothetical protein